MKHYPRYSAEVNDLLDFARAVRRFAAEHPDAVNVNDILQYVDRTMADNGWSLLDIVLDHEERQARFVAMWRKHRRRLRRSRLSSGQC